MSLLENKSYLSPVWARYTDILVERGEGACLYAVDGRSYLDFTCGIGVTNTGHCHPRVVAAIREQAGLLLHGQANIVYHKPLLELVGALRPVVPAPLDSFFFSNSGAEAVEGAIKLARHATGRSDVIAFVGGFRSMLVDCVDAHAALAFGPPVVGANPVAHPPAIMPSRIVPN